MPVIAVANPKGGCRQVHASHERGRLFREPGACRRPRRPGPPAVVPPLAQPPAAGRAPHRRLGNARRRRAAPPRDATHAVLDTPAGLHGAPLKEVLKLADKVVVPLQPSVFDIFATRSFLDELAAHRQAASTRIGIVGMRVDARTIAADKLQAFVEGLGLPVLGMLRDTQNYIHLAAQGLSLFDVSPGRVARDLEQWKPICDWLSGD